MVAARHWLVVLGACLATMLAVPAEATAQEGAPATWPTPAPSPEVASSPSPDDPILSGLGAEVVLLTEREGVGERPLLAWETVPGAMGYGVYVFAPSGEVYWMWFGADTAVHVGGEPLLRDGAPGPSIVAGMSWAVLAYDADRLPLAASPRRTLDP